MVIGNKPCAITMPPASLHPGVDNVACERPLVLPVEAAEIEWRNATREAPQDPVLRARLAEVYLQLGDAQLAEREVRGAREHNGKEADYLPVLADALLRQEKFADLMDLAPPGDRNPVIKSKVRTARGVAAAELRDQAKAETLLGETIKLDPKALRLKIRLARLLSGTKLLG